jgi:hypothetical protein
MMTVRAVNKSGCSLQFHALRNLVKNYSIKKQRLLIAVHVVKLMDECFFI